MQRERRAVREVDEHAFAGSGDMNRSLADLMADTGDLRAALFSLPYGNGSRFFAETEYFVNVRKFSEEFDFVLKKLALPPGAFVLDAGADLTWSTARLAERGYRAVAIDINHHLAAARLFRERGLDFAAVNVDMHAPAFADGAFDAVTAFNALHHTHRIDDVLLNVGRVLRPGGRLGFVEPFCLTEQEREAFGRAQIELGINENVYLLEEWHAALARAGLRRVTCLVNTAFSAVYEKLDGGCVPFVSLEAARDDFFAGYYRATLAAPELLPEPLSRGALSSIPLSAANMSSAAWCSTGSLPVFASYHLYQGDGRQLIAFDNIRTPLPGVVEAGACVSIDLRLAVPEQPGDYVAVIDLVHESRTWFADRGVEPAMMRFHVR